MKNSVKKIISLLITVCVLLSLAPVVPVSANYISLDQQGYVYGEMEQHYFTPENSGFYRLKITPGEWGDCHVMSVYDEEYCPIPYLLSVMHHDEMPEYGGMPPQSNVYYLEAGSSYTFEINSMGGTSYYIMTEEAMNDLGEYEHIGENISAQVSGTSLSLLSYTAEDTKEVLFSAAEGLINVYDIINKTDYGYGGTSQVTFTPEEGNEYYIILGTPDSSMYVDITLTSSYVEQVDNSKVETSNVSDMQSSHPYQNNLDKKWVYYAPVGTIYNEIIFDNSCGLSYYSDYLYVYDANDNQVAFYDRWDSFAGKKLTIPGNSFSIKLVSDETNVGYGFALSSVKSFSEVDAPVANIESGKIRPSNVTVSANSLATIYYRLSTKENTGEFTQYSSAISITEDCTLELYAKIGSSVSETVTYNYTINNAPVPAPEFSVVSSTAGSIKLAITASEGDVYYKRMTSGTSYYKLSAGNAINVYESDVIAAYAMMGTLKSKTTYYSCEIADNNTYELLAPIITETPIMGGKEVTISMPDGFEFVNKEDFTNYNSSHPEEECEYYPHSMGPWSAEYVQTFTRLYAGDATSRIECINYYNAEDFPRTYTIYENTSFSAQSEYNYSYESGEWVVYDMGAPWGYGPYSHELYNPEYGSSNLETAYKKSARSYKYVEVPKAEKPEFAIIGGKLNITAADGMIIYYRVNDGLDDTYSEPIDVKSGDIVYARAEGLGVTNSDEAECKVELRDVSINSAAVLGGYEVEITSGKADATLYYSANGEDFKPYTEKLFAAEDTTISAYAIINGEQSEMETISLTVKEASAPSPTCESGTYPLGTKLGFLSADANEIIYCIIDEEEKEYTEEIILEDDIKIGVYAIGMGIAKSEVVNYSYSVLKAIAPQINENNILGGKRISISTTTEGGSIYYKLNDGEYALYTEPFDVYDLTKIYAYTAIEGASNSAVTEHSVSMLQTAAPVPNYASGEVFSGTQIELSSPNNGLETVIYYTLDNTEPSMESTLYIGSIAITEPVTIKAVAYAMGCAKSDVTALTYTLRTTKAPSFTEQNVKGGKKIYISSETADAEFYYTLDGTDPKTSDSAVLYEAPFVVGVSGTVIRAFARATGYLDSEISVHTVEIGRLPAPVFGVADENVYLNTAITITADPISDIYYTLDGTDPSKENGTLYTAPIIITGDVTIKAIAVSDGWQASDITEKTYTVYVTETPYITRTKNGDSMKIELKSETPDATIYYTLDGTEPTSTSNVYKDAILISADTTIKAFAASENRKQSAYLTQTVLVRHVSDPISSIPSGEIRRTDEIILTSDGNATIYYTLDGSDPTEESEIYTSPITLSGSTTLKAVAMQDGLLDSSIVTYEYTIKRTKNAEISLNEDILGGKSIKIESADIEAAIYYTLDGTEPTVNEANKYTGPFNIYKTTVIRALAVAEGCDTSELSYREMAVPVADLIGYNIIYVLKNDIINHSLSSQTVYYTLDGSEPTLESAIYEPGTIVIDKNTTMRVFAIGNGYAKSKDEYFHFYITPVDITTSLKYGENTVDVTIEAYPASATVYYTIDGSDPSLETNTKRILYTGSFTLTENANLKIFASADRYRNIFESRKIYINRAETPQVYAKVPYYTISYPTSSEIAVKEGKAVSLRSPDGLKIKYTLDGTTPTEENGTDYTEPITIDDTTIIKAYCYGENYENSLVKTITASVLKVFGDISCTSVPGGKRIEIQPRAGTGINYCTYMQKTFGEFTVYYTTDGTEPTTNSPIYMQVNESGEYTVSPPEKWLATENVTVKTLVVAAGCITEDTISEDVVVEKLNPPSAMPAETVIYKNSYITLETAEPGAKIYYTLDNSEPTEESAVYEAPFTLSDDTTIKMIAVKNGKATSDIAEVRYTIKRADTPTYKSELLASGMLITLDCETEGAKIYYTLNGETPTSAATLYTEPFKLKKNTILSFVAIRDNMKESFVVSEVINVPMAELSIVGISNSQASPGGYVDVMLYFQKNISGVSAYSISVEYDKDVLTPVSAKNLWGGIFTTNIGKGEQSGIENAVSMVWLSSTSTYESGNAAKITFKVNDNATAQTLPLYIKENGVINHLYERVDVAYMDGSVEIDEKAQAAVSIMSLETEKRTQYTDTRLSMTTNIENDKLTVKVMVTENSGIGAYNISMLYDNAALTPVSAENGELFESSIMSNVTEPGRDISQLSEITVLSCNDKDSTDNGVLYTLTFDINTSDADGQMIGFSDVMLLDVSGNEIVGIYEDKTVDSEIKTATKIESGMITVNPQNVPAGKNIIVAGYNNENFAFCKVFVKDGSPIAFAAPDVAFDEIRVFIWDDLTTMSPASETFETVPVN